MNRSGFGGLVYSTDSGRMCPVCRKPVDLCSCADAHAAAVRQGDGMVRVCRETKGRGGKTVTVIRGLAISVIELAALGKRLKAACGSGGTVKDGLIEVQGDHCERVIDYLKKDGFRAKRAGG